MKALVNSPICPLKSRPHMQRELADEVLYGSTVEILEDTCAGWYRIRTPYRYEGYAPAEGLLFGEHNVARWEALPSRSSARASVTYSPPPWWRAGVWRP